MLKQVIDDLEFIKDVELLDCKSLLKLTDILIFPKKLRTKNNLQILVKSCRYQERDRIIVEDFIKKFKSQGITKKEIVINRFYQSFLTPLINVPKHVSVHGMIVFTHNVKGYNETFYNIKITKVEGDYTVVKPGERVFAKPEHINTQ